MAMQNVFNILVDLKVAKTIPQPLVTQNDSVVFILEVMQDGVPFDLTDTTTVSLAHTRKDQTVVVTPGTKVGNKATFALGTNETSVTGAVTAKAQFYDAEGRVSTLSFSYQVGLDPTGSGYVPSTSEATLIEVVLNDGPLIIASAEEAAAYANEQGDYALQVGVDNETRYLNAVSSVVLRDSTYPLPAHGDTVRITELGRTDRYVLGTGWVTTDVYNPLVIDELSSQLAEKATKGEIISADLKILNESDRLGLVNLKEEVIQAMAGTTSVNSIPANYSVTPTKTSFFKVGKNLFDKTTVTSGYFVNDGTGALSVGASYSASDYIPILPSTSYIMTRGSYYAFYDANKTFISGAYGANALPKTVATPVNAAFIRVTIYTSELATFQLEKGTAVTVYESYHNALDVVVLPNKNFITKTMLNNGIVSIDKTDFITIGKNKFDVTKATMGYVVNEATGAIYAHVNYYASDYIPVIGNTAYTQSTGRYMAFYDVNKIFISGLGNASTVSVSRTFTTPSNAVYMRVSVGKEIEELNYYQVELGSTATAHESHRYELDEKIIAQAESMDELLLFLPSEICVAVGRTIEIYNNQVVWCGNIDNYHFKWDCTIGKAMKRKFSVIGTVPLIGEYPLSLTIYDNNMNVVAIGSTLIKIVTNVIVSAKNLLNIGDSLTNEKPALGELRTLSSNQFTMIGTRGTAPLKHEGRSGWSAASYLANTTYSYDGTVNPFWDGTRFNFNYYKTNSVITPDAVQLFLGTNGMSLDPTTNANNIKQIVDYIRQDDATIPIFVVYTLYRGNQDGIGNETGSDGYAVVSGSWKLQEDRKVFNLMVKVNDLLKSYTNLRFVPISVAHDSEFNFGAVSTQVNPRATQTELLPSQATHPQLQGYQQMADIMFSTFAKYLNT